MIVFLPGVGRAINFDRVLNVQFRGETAGTIEFPAHDPGGTRRRVRRPAAIVFDSEEDARIIRSVVGAQPPGA